MSKVVSKFMAVTVVALAVALPTWAQSDTRNESRDRDKDTKSSQDTGNQTRQDVVKRLDDAAADLNRTVGAPDNGIPETILAKARCVAIVPTLLKAGFVFGAQHGRGVATCRVNNAWSAPAFFTVTGGSWGAQIGAEGVDLVMLFMDQAGANKLLDSNWKIGGDVSIAAGPFGREASANTSAKFDTSILTYSRAKGLFAGATLNGANIRQDTDSMRAFYGRDVNFRDALMGKVQPPPHARQFLASVRTDFREAKASE